MNQDLEILRRGNSDLRKELAEIKQQRDKACKDYLDLYAKMEQLKELVKELVIKQRYQVTKSHHIEDDLDHLGDLNRILKEIERKK